MGIKELTSLEGFERQPFEEFAESAYLNYSMYVILDRALPYIGDGLKPVQRRIVYAMSQLGLSSGAKYKKSARTVGDVLGKYHPHGDSACYEAMVLLAQPFSCRYPLLDGQGNWGAPDDPKSFAAMRYTESKLSKYADILLSELDLGATEWTVNFDGTLNEPTLMPARLPNILLNGTTGIAVGMATDIPPHNLNEVALALVHLLAHPDATLDKICEFIKGPDYPTEAEIITAPSEIREMYLTGNGRIRMRAKYHVDDGDIIVTALPHHSSGEKILEQIAAQMQAKKLPMVVDLRDESDHEEPTRLVIIPKARTNTTALMDHLFATTDLERTYRVNMNMIGTNGRPEVKPLLTVLSEWLAFRIDTVRKRLKHRLEKVNDRIHLLDGLLTAFLNIDEIIAIIRNNDEPKPILMETFNLSDRQATAILEIKLRSLAKLEEIKIRAEKKSLDAERLQIEKILASDKRLRTLIKKEIQADAKKHGDDRRSPILERKEAEAFSEEDVIQVEPMTVILSKNGWVRGAKGDDVDVEKLKFKSGDELLSTAPAMSNRPAVFFDSTGRSYSIPVHTLASARTMGEPLTGRLTVKPEAHISGLVTGDDGDLFLLYTDTGFGFITQFSNLTAKSRTGKAVLTLGELAEFMPPQQIKNPATDLLTVITTSGRMIIFPVKEMPIMEKGKGNKIIGIPKNQLSIEGTERIKILKLLPEGAEIVIYAGKHFLKLTVGNQTNYRSKRGYRGKRLPRGFQNVHRIKVLPLEK